MMESKSGKKTLGRRKIEIKKIEERTSLQVTFSKRRKGLFKKACELSVLCGAEIAILVQSPAEKMYAFGHPTVGALINRVESQPAAEAASSRTIRRGDDDDGRGKCAEAARILEMEKMRTAERETRGLWWEERIEGLELHELEEFAKALEGLRVNVGRKLVECDKKAVFAPPIGDYASASLELYADQDYLLDLMNFELINHGNYQ